MTFVAASSLSFRNTVIHEDTRETNERLALSQVATAERRTTLLSFDSHLKVLLKV